MKNKHIDGQYVEINAWHKIVYILADKEPIASVEIISEPIALSKNEANNVAIADFVERIKEEQSVATVNVNCKKEQVLTSYKKYFK